jgi:hypothetical protein
LSEAEEFLAASSTPVELIGDPMPHIFVDADACPMKAEVYRVAERCDLCVTIVANKYIRVPEARWVELQVVGDHPDAADDWIVEHVAADVIVVTPDVPLASRCLEQGAQVLSPTGKRFTDDNIGDIVATRDLLDNLRGFGEITSGPPPLSKRDRSNFLQRLDEVVQEVRRRQS